MRFGRGEGDVQVVSLDVSGVAFIVDGAKFIVYAGETANASEGVKKCTKEYIN